MFKAILLTVSCLFSGLFAAPPNLSPPVLTKNGVLIGHRVNAGGMDVYEFDGIPYAEPPVGTLRFKKTQSKMDWPNALLTIFPPPACPQTVPTPFGAYFTGTQNLRVNTTMSENCLFLNIWVPRAAMDPLYYFQGDSINKSAPPPNWNNLPVLVYFQGGGYTFGGTNFDRINGTVLSAMNNIIVVTVQYRIGALGFLYAGTNEVPGNMGLWDQVEALKWLCDNIASFGGNCSQTTIAGQSAGGASVAYHLISPYSRQYFQRAILESGTAISDWAIETQSEARQRSDRLAESISTECPNNVPTNTVTSNPCRGCAVSTSTYTSVVMTKLNCLRSLDAMRFAQRQYEVLYQDNVGSPGILPIPFAPVIDGDFVPRNPRDMLSSYDFYNVSILAGVNKEEGSTAVVQSLQGLKMLPNPLVLNRSFDNFDRASYEGLINSYFYFYPRNGIVAYPVIQEGIRLIYEALSDDGQIMVGQGVIDRVVQAVGDWAFSCPTISWADAYAHAPDNYKIKTYLYYFTERSSQNPWPKWMGVVHGEEVPFVFGEPLAGYAAKMTYTEEEKTLSRVMMAYWSNFAKYGDPNRPDQSSRNQANSLSLRPWPVYDEASGKMAANINILTRVRQQGDGTIYGLKRRECAFWLFLSHVYSAITTAGQCGRTSADMILLGSLSSGNATNTTTTTATTTTTTATTTTTTTTISNPN